MEQFKFDESNGLWYELHGDYYLPCLLSQGEGKPAIGIWGQRHLQFLRQHKRELYSALILSGKLEDYLADINRRAEVIFLQVVRQLSEKEEVTEKMKAESQMEWVGRMNNIRARAREIVNGEIVNI